MKIVRGLVGRRWWWWTWRLVIVLVFMLFPLWCFCVAMLEGYFFKFLGVD